MRRQISKIGMCLAIALLACGAHGEDFGVCFGSGGTVEASAPELPADGKQLCVEFRFKALAPMGPAIGSSRSGRTTQRPPTTAQFHFDLLPNFRMIFRISRSTVRSTVAAP